MNYDQIFSPDWAIAFWSTFNEWLGQTLGYSSQPFNERTGALFGFVMLSLALLAAQRVIDMVKRSSGAEEKSAAPRPGGGGFRNE